MPLDEEELNEVEEKTSKADHKVQSALYEALNPREALSAMQKEEYDDGKAFTSRDIAKYVEESIRKAADENPRSEGEASSIPHQEEARQLERTLSDTVKEQVANLDYIQDEITEDKGFLKSLISGEDSYKQGDLRNYIEDSLYSAEDVNNVKQEGDTYFTLEESE